MALVARRTLVREVRRGAGRGWGRGVGIAILEGGGGIALCVCVLVGGVGEGEEGVVYGMLCLIWSVALGCFG